MTENYCTSFRSYIIFITFKEMNCQFRQNIISNVFYHEVKLVSSHFI